MICAACGTQEETGDAETCSNCGGPQRLQDRYELLEVLGQRSGGTTYRACDVDTQDAVVVKELSLRSTESLKEVELFEREAKLLEGLVHPAIPRFLAHFEVRRGKTISLYIVQELVTGRSVESTLADSRWTAPEIAGLMADVCGVLSYLKDANVVHRDIKPSNLLRREDGELVIVDFGAARVVAETLHRGGSTVTGTFGYMAPEQMVGDATPATDVFGLGATALRLLTGREPHELWSASHGFDYDRQQFDSGLVGVIDAMTAPRADDRPGVVALARDLRIYSDAGGKRRALMAYAHQMAAVPRGDSLTRPASSTAWVGLRESVKVALVSILAVVGLSAVVVAPHWGSWLALSLVGSQLVSIPLFVTLLKGLSRALLFRRGAGVRGVVLARDVFGAWEGEMFAGRRFVVDYRFRVGELEYEEQSRVSEEVFVAADPGDEVAVWYSPGTPSRSAISLLDAQRGLLE